MKGELVLIYYQNANNERNNVEKREYKVFKVQVHSGKTLISKANSQK